MSGFGCLKEVRGWNWIKNKKFPPPPPIPPQVFRFFWFDSLSSRLKFASKRPIDVEVFIKWITQNYSFHLQNTPIIYLLLYLGNYSVQGIQENDCYYLGWNNFCLNLPVVEFENLSLNPEIICSFCLSAPEPLIKKKKVSIFGAIFREIKWR